MAEFQLLWVGTTEERSVRKLNKWTIPCVVFGHFGGALLLVVIWFMIKNS